ncbi:pyridoxal phosphate-dependent aminotransferase [Sphingomonas sp. BIUV-7]|uniref:Pyridoxal phosphate-dependent aminotransferase n=1 Tax=Sphingomonas natans TaxID=3063330 RepID=A0ABT8Y3C7_9SPHN|nr:pyridoxal phosphate-dependent aminotransferase [Sphingomonas sp. BIUV-7]MDO6412810.1 pyridoxal phosphate-dependent aminotransferase [Sphingomonas sp. BIUV-7]
MELPPFLLNEWLERPRDLSFNLAGSAGPRWTMRELLRLCGGEPDLAEHPLSYAPTAGAAALRAEIAAHHDVDPDWVVLTTGAAEALLLLLSVLSRPGGNVLLPMPGYAAFAGTARFVHLDPRSYPLARERGFGIDLAQVAALADGRTVAAMTNCPHNPSGAVIEPTECRSLARALAGKGVPLVVDEVFHPIYFGDPRPSAAGIENVIVTGDMSKALSMPGLRLGWVIDADAKRRESMIRARSYIAWSGSPVLEALGLQAMRSRRAILERTTRVASANLEELRSFMTRMRDILNWVPPQGGLIAFPWFRDGRDSRPFCERMAERGVLLAPGDCFGMPDHMRIGFGSQTDGIAPALAIIEDELRRA